MASSELIDRNREALAAMLAEILREQSRPGYYGSGSLSWSIRDGLVQGIVSVAPVRECRIPEKTA